MAASHVQAPNGSAASGTTQTRSYASNVTAGSMLVAMPTWYSGTVTLGTLTDTLGNTWVHVDPALPYRGPSALGSPTHDCWYCLSSVSGGANTVTFPFSGSVGASILLYEVTGNNTTAPYDKFVSATGATNSTIDPGPLNTAEANEFILCAGSDNNNYPGAGTGYVEGTRMAANFWDPFQYQMDAGAQNATEATAFGGTASGWSAIAVAFKQAAAGGGGTTRGTPFGHRGTAFNGGRAFHGIIQ